MNTEEKKAIIDGLKEKYGRIFELSDEDSDYGLVIVRPLTKLEYRKLKEQRDDDTRKHMADEFVAQTAIVYPDAIGAQRLIDQFPVFAASVMVAVLKVSGSEDLRSKKL
jgi:hypothetical protein